MKICAVVFLLGVMIKGAASMIHTLRYFTTASSEISGFPQFVSVGIVNDLVISHYDSNTKRAVPKQEWMNRVREEDPQYWERNTQKNLNYEPRGKVNIETAKQRLNETGGSHMAQYMQGCDWDDETDEIRGYVQDAFDGEDFISLDWATQTWVAPKQQAFPTKLKWERNGVAAYWKTNLEHVCAEYLKKYVGYGEKTLKRKELPEVWFLQKSSSSPVTCFATGFYPDRAMLFWTKDGEELLEDWGGILPNHDGTFQSSVSLDLSSVPTGDWGRYSCVFQLSGVKDDLITKLDPGLIRTNEKKYTPYIVAAACVLGAVVCALIGYFLYRRYKAKQLSPQSSEPEVMQELNPQPPETQ
uniref:Ig-like domain-containing protein n=1 Tax=Neogobius melanostomus TaxID=47308 RepID=A0A8C6UJA0_9GOBI